MTLVKATLPLIATLLLTQSAAIAGPAAALDPYAYIAAPTKEERELILAKKHKKAKVAKSKKTIAIKVAKPKDTQAEEPAAEVAAQEPSTTEAPATASAGMVGNFKSMSSKIVGSESLLGKGAKSISQGFVAAGEKVKGGSGGVGEKMASGFKSAGGKIVGGTQALGQNVVKTASKVGSSSGETVKKLATAPAASFGAIGHGMNKLNPFHKEDSAAPAIANKGDKSAQPQGNKDEADRLVYPESTAATESAIPQ